jgi:hypothetical protein
MNKMNGRARAWLWLFVFLSGVIFLAAAILPPIPQPLEYHEFADRRVFLGVPSFLNVVSNLALLFCGAAGLVFLLRSPVTLDHTTFIQLSERWPYILLFLSVVMTCFGSAYYHWDPDNERLLWDRLPIATGITALLAATLVERVSLKVGLQALPWLILFGIGSVLYWYWSEQKGAGNLNFYIMTQFYSLLLIILLGLLLPSRYTHGTVMYRVIGLYGIAKIAESLDREIYELSGIISGHTLKHLLGALAVYWILRMLQRRSPVLGMR